MNQLVYLVYGNSKDIIDEAKFSILSAIYRSPDHNSIKIVVITDTAEAFSNLPVATKTLDKNELKEWSGPENYNHRRKPNALLKMLGDAEKTILIDTDTVFKKDPSLLFDKIDNNSILVDKISQKWHKTPDYYFHTCNSFLSSHYGINNNLRHINSGLIGLTQSNKNVIEDTIKIIDQIYTLSGKLFDTEQFSLAVALASNNLTATTHNNIIFHYWSRKSIHREIARSFLRNHPKPLSEQAKQDFLNFQFSIPCPPLWYRLYLKLLSKSLKNETQLRQFFIELRKALYPYKKCFRIGTR